MSEAIEFTVLGEAAPAGSKKAFPFKKQDGRLGVRVGPDNPKSKPWQARVAAAAREVYSGELLEGPLRLYAYFYKPRPKGHYGAKGLKASAPAYPTTRPDALKLGRCLEDGLNKVLWRDDSQVVHVTAEKRYGEPARAEVRVEKL